MSTRIPACKLQQQYAQHVVLCSTVYTCLGHSLVREAAIALIVVLHSRTEAHASAAALVCASAGTQASSRAAIISTVDSSASTRFLRRTSYSSISAVTAPAAVLASSQKQQLYVTTKIQKCWLMPRTALNKDTNHMLHVQQHI